MSDNLIVPGVRIGPVSLGDTRREVQEKLGPFSSSIIMGPMGSGTESFDKAGLAVSYANDVACTITVTSHAYFTAQGIGLGNIAQQVRSAFKNGAVSTFSFSEENAKHRKRKVTAWCYNLAKPGIMFEFSNLHDPAHTYCTCIVVHQKGVTYENVD